MSSISFAYCRELNAGGVIAFEASGIMETLKTNLTAASADVANDTIKALTYLTQELGRWINPYLLEILPEFLPNFARTETAVAAEQAGHSILHKFGARSALILITRLYESFTSVKWQTRLGAVMLFGDLAEHQPMVVQRNLYPMINRLIVMASDAKKEVKEQTCVAFGKITATITNVDIIPIIPRVVAAYIDPKLTENALEALIFCTTFTNVVDLPTLGLLVPVLTRGVTKGLWKRRYALVIGNMCKLVKDPRIAAEFKPVLKPLLEHVANETHIEEVRAACEHSLTTLERVAGDAKVLSDAVFTHADLVNSINKSLTKNGVADTSKFAKLVDFAAKGAHFLVKGDNGDQDEWFATMVPYLKAMLPTEEKVNAVAQEVIAEGTAALSPVPVIPIPDTTNSYTPIDLALSIR